MKPPDPRILTVATAAVLVRLPWLQARSLWFDEIFTANAVTYEKSLAGIINVTIARDAHPPLYYLLMWFWAHLSGIYGTAWPEPPAGIELYLRLPSVLLGGANATLVYLLARRYFSPTTAAIAGLLYAFHPYAIYQDTQARMYPLLTFAWLLMVYALALYLDRPGRRAALGFGLAGALALWTHYLAPFLILPGLAILAATTIARKRLRELGLAIAPMLSFLIWLPAFWHQLKVAAVSDNPRLPVPYNLYEIFLYLSGTTLTRSERWQNVQLTSVWTLGGLGWYALTRHPRARTATLLFVVWPLATFTLWWAASTYAVNISSVRYASIFTPFAALALAAALDWIGRQLRSYAVPVLGAASLVVLFMIAQLPLYPVPLENWRDAASVLRALKLQPGDTIMTTYSSRMLALLYYYRPPEGVQLRTTEPPRMPEPEPGHRTVFIPVRVGSQNYGYGENGLEFAHYVLEHYRFLGRPFGGAPMYHYPKTAGGAP